MNPFSACEKNYCTVNCENIITMLRAQVMRTRNSTPTHDDFRLKCTSRWITLCLLLSCSTEMVYCIVRCLKVMSRRLTTKLHVPSSQSCENTSQFSVMTALTQLADSSRVNSNPTSMSFDCRFTTLSAIGTYHVSLCFYLSATVIVRKVLGVELTTSEHGHHIPGAIDPVAMCANRCMAGCLRQPVMQLAYAIEQDTAHV